MPTSAYSSPSSDVRAVKLAGDLALRLMNDAIGALRRAGVTPMPLKGVLLLARWPELRGRRDLADVDLLMPLEAFGDAERALRTIGFEPTSRTSRGTTLASEQWPLSIDLHHRLFRPHLFRVPTVELIARATRDESLFSGAVMRMSDADLFAHVLGHLAKSRQNLEDEAAVADVKWLLRELDVPAVALATHLRQLRMQRASGYVLSASGLGDDPVAAAIVQALGLSGADQRLINLARAQATAYWTPHLINGRLIDGARSLVFHSAESVRWRIRRWTAVGARV